MTALPDIELPLALSGPWEHALFLSYGLDLPFFERTILPNLPGTCRNRILLGDEKTYLASCDHFAESGLVRHANARYVAEPILRRRSSHAKLLLLTAPEAGWLAVGSGNVSMQGYASGGELFTTYNYASAGDDDLAEFVSVRELLERFRDDSLLSRTAAWHVDRLLEETSWLFRAATAASRVRHNLDTSFLDQLIDAIGGEPVEHLWVLAPFFDEHASALGDLIDGLSPDLTTVLLQPGRTSVDPAALTELIAASATRIELRSVTRLDDPWIHAKLFIAQTAKSAICLQGSANASIAAFVRTDRNFEMGNLLRGSPSAFDDVLGGLEIGDVVLDAADLDVRYESSDDTDHFDDVGWQLTGAEWSEGNLRISYRGALPNTTDSQLLRRGTSVAIESVEPGAPLVLHFSDDVRELLGGADPIRLQFADGTQSNAIFPCDRASLNATLQASPESDERLSRIGHLDLDDDELELLLQELEATMVIDRRSLWQLAGKRGSVDEPPDGDELHLDYDDVDYELLRGHPKLRQYLFASGGAGTHGRSRLQIVLNAITGSFTELLEPQHAATAAAVAALADEGDVGSQADDAEGDDDERDADRRRWSRQARINVLLRNFINRFVAGLSSTTFQEAAGPEVLASNYVIFLHLLSRLYERDWIDVETLVEATAATIETMWGSDRSPSYIARLGADDAATVLSLIREKHSDAQLIALVYLFARDTRQSRGADPRLLIRNAWRGVLVGGRLPLDCPAVRDVAVLLRPTEPPEGPRLVDAAEELRRLADYRTREELMDDVHQRFGTSPGTWYFDKVTVRIPPRPESVSVECLLIDDDGIVLSLEDAQWLLAAWMQVEERSYYRVQVRSRTSASSRFVAFYQPAHQRGVYAAVSDREASVALTALHVASTPWDNAMLDLMVAAEQVDAERPSATIEDASA